MCWKHTCSREEKKEFLKEKDWVPKQLHCKRIRYPYPPKETFSLNQSFNRKRKSKSNSILHLTSLFCVPALRSMTLLLSFVSILVSRASPVFPISSSCLCTVTAQRPSRPSSTTVVPRGRTLTAPEAPAEPEQMRSAWSQLHPPGQGWLTSLGVWKWDFWRKRGRNTKVSAKLVSLVPALLEAIRAKHKSRASHAVWHVLQQDEGLQISGQKTGLEEWSIPRGWFSSAKLGYEKAGTQCSKRQWVAVDSYTRKPQITDVKQRTTAKMMTSVSKSSYMKKSGLAQ